MTLRVEKLDNPEGLSDGMSIIAHVRARVLGMKLIELDADIQVAPRKTLARITRIAAGEAPKEIESDPLRQISARARNGHPPGNRLAVAAEALRSGAGDLEAARRQMP